MKRMNFVNQFTHSFQIMVDKEQRLTVFVAVVRFLSGQESIHHN